MTSCFLTLLFYAASCFLVVKRSTSLTGLLLAIGSLPVAWISFAAVAGLMNTLTGLPPLIPLGVVVATLIVRSIILCRRDSIAVVAQPIELPWWALAVASVCFLGAMVIVHRQEPWGGWDTMFTWVLRAWFFDVGGSQWSNAFSNDLALLHPDYPPMLSWALDALWKVDGQATPAAMVTLFCPFWPAFAFVVFGFQSIASDRLRLAFSSAVVLSTPILWKLAASFLADFALAYAILGSCAWYTFAVSKSNRRAPWVAGFFAAWSGLLKNEGVVWLIAFNLVAISVALVFRSKNNWSLAGKILAGGAGPFLAVIVFKLALAPPSDLANPTRCSEIGEIVQPGVLVNPDSFLARIDQCELVIFHDLIWRRLFEILFEPTDWGLTLWWCLLMLLHRLRWPALFPALMIAIAIQAGIYYFVYLTTPYHIWWHLSNSLSRILAHIVPAAVCLLAFGSIEPPNPSRANRQQAEINRRWTNRAAAIYLVCVSVGCLITLLRGDWNYGKQPLVNVRELHQIQLPDDPVISYVSSSLGTRDLYATQFAAAPKLLVVDRREKTLLARFPTEAELRQYCDANGWDLKANQGGLGWARDSGGRGLRQPVTVDRIH